MGSGVGWWAGTSRAKVLGGDGMTMLLGSEKILLLHLIEIVSVIERLGSSSSKNVFMLPSLLSDD